MRGDQQGGTHPPGGGRGLLSGLGIASRHRMDGVLSKVLYPGAWFGSGPLGLVEPGIFLWRWVLRPGSGARIGYRRTGGQWAGVGPSGGTSCTDGEPGSWDQVDIQGGCRQRLANGTWLVRHGTSGRAGSSAFLSLCGGETIGSRPHRVRPHRQLPPPPPPPPHSRGISGNIRHLQANNNSTRCCGPSQRGDRDGSRVLADWSTDDGTDQSLTVSLGF